MLDSIAQQPAGKYTEQDGKELFRQVLEGIKYLHEASVAHRDIKPQNILIDAVGRPRLADFDISIEESVKSTRQYTTMRQCGGGGGADGFFRQCPLRESPTCTPLEKHWKRLLR